MRRIEAVVVVAVGVAGVLIGRALAPSAEAPRSDGEARSAEALEAAVSRALREPRTSERAGALVRLFEGLTTTNAEGAARAYRGAAGEDDPVDLQLYLSALSRLDPVAAMAEVETWPFQSRRELGIRIVIREWAASGQSLEAGAYVDSLTDRETRAVAIAPLIRGWALSGDVDRAQALARKYWELEGRRDVADALVAGVLRIEGAPGALALARGLEPRPDDPFAQGVALSALRLAGREAPEAAAAYYDELLRKGPAPWLAGSLVRIAALLRNGDARAAIEWTLAKPEGPERTRALAETMATWAKRDLDAAWKWFDERRAQSADADAALSATDSTLVGGLVRRTARIRPSQAAEWAPRIVAVPERLEMLRRVAYFWSMEDPAAADRWIESLVLAPSDRDRIREAATWGRSSSDDAPSDMPDDPADDPADAA